MSRPTNGDGHTTTGALAPCRCPECGGQLIITCERGCPEAERGAIADVDPIARLRAPRSDDRRRAPRGRPGARSGPRVGGTRDKVLAALRAQPATLRTLMEVLDMPGGRLSFMLFTLAKCGAIEGRLAPGARRGMTYHVVQKNRGGGGHSHDGQELTMRRAA